MLQGTGNTVVKALNVLKANKVQEKNVVLLNLFITPNGLCQHWFDLYFSAISVGIEQCTVPQNFKLCPMR